MAIVDYSAINAALSQEFAPRLVRAMNRHALLATLLRKVPGSGKNVAWDVQFSTGGAVAETFNDGADASSYGSDVDVPATLNWARYRSNFQLSGLAQSAAATSQSPDDLMNLIMDKAIGAGSKLLSMINADLYTGSGGTNIIAGLGQGVVASGTYANIAIGTYSEWAATVDANGGTARPLTKDLMDGMELKVSKACGVSPNCIVTTFETGRKYEGLFDSAAKYEGKPPDLAILAGIQDSLAIPPVLVRNLLGYYKGIPVFRDKDCPAGFMYFLNMDELELQFLPPLGGSTAVMSGQQALVGNQVDPVSGLMAKVEALSKSGDSDKFTLVLYPQLKIRRPNAQGVLKDISET